MLFPRPFVDISAEYFMMNLYGDMLQIGITPEE